MRKTFKKLIALFLLSAVLLSTALLGGCYTMTEYDYSEGITLTFLSDSEALIEVVAQVDSTNLDPFKDSLTSVISTHFGESLPAVDRMTDGYTLFAYSVVKEDGFSIEPSGDVDDGIFFADVDVEFPNPFIADPAFSGFLSQMESEQTLNALTQTDITSVLTVLMPVSKRNIKGAESVDRDFVSFARWVLVADARFLPDLSLSYRALVPAGWFIVIILTASTVVGLIILLAKKGDGSLIELNPAPVTVDVFEGFN